MRQALSAVAAMLVLAVLLIGPLFLALSASAGSNVADAPCIDGMGCEGILEQNPLGS